LQFTAFKVMPVSHATSLRNTHIQHYQGYMSNLPADIGLIYSFVFI